MKSADDILNEVLNRFDQHTTCVVDVETSGLDWKRNHIVGYALAFGPAPQDSYYVPFRHAGSANVGGRPGPNTATGWDGKRHPAEAKIVEALERPGSKTTFHNGGFDLKFMYRVGLNKFNGNYEDTQINAALINEWQGRFSLAACCKIAGVQAKLDEEMKAYLIAKFGHLGANNTNAMGHYWRLPGDDAMAREYAEGDGTSTWQLRDWQETQIRDQDLEEVHALECRLINVLVRMSTFGIKIGTERLDQLLHDTAYEIEQLMDKFPSGFNVKSPDNVRQWMEKHGHTDWPTTLKKGAPSFTEDWLMKHEAGRAIVGVRKLETLRNTFLIPMRDTHMWNGRVHPDYNQLRGDEYGTVTGRLSCSNPNLQAASKRNKDIGGRHRSVFVADEGQRWLSADYTQCEPTLLAFYSRCKVLLDGYRANPPVDAHQAVADATGLDRETGKRVNQTLITGGGKGVLVEKYKVPADKIDQIWRDYFRSMPEIKKLQDRAKHLMEKRGYIVSPLGRRARLKAPGKGYMGMNRLLQSGNADVIKLKMVQIDDYCRSEGFPVRVLNNVHDSLDFQFHPDNRKHMDECLRIMQDFGPGQPIELDLPLVADYGEGADWAEATYG